MTRKELRQTDSTDLRRLAEERLGENTSVALPHGTEEDLLKLLHELQVHEIELEMQNDELRKGRDDMAALLEKNIDLYDFAPVAYYTLDRKGTILAANLTGAALLGIERSRLIDRHFVRFVPDDSRSVFSDFLARVLSSPAKESCELTLLKEGNSSLCVQLEAVTATSGEECRIAAIDISERKRCDDEVKKLNVKLEARTAELESYNQNLAAFNFMASHDLCQPLNNVYTSAQAIELLCVDKIDEESKEFLQIIKKGSMNMKNLIGMFLRFSQSERADLNCKMGDLSEIARAITAGLRVSDPKRQVTFKIDEGVKVYGDPELLRVALENIIENAWKFTGNLEQAIIEFGTMEMDGRKTYFVRDNGRGFDMREAEKLFLPFKRLQGSEELAGHGIGLATVERIIRRHGGKIWAVGEPDKGATFFFTLGE
jgi:PAS domain S-box-containing protein